MTTNQLAFQRNAIEEANVRETERKNKASEALRAQELAQQLSLKEKELNQSERANAAKYGYTTYMSPNEERGNSREVFNLIREGFDTLFNPLLKIFGGKR